MDLKTTKDVRPFVMQLATLKLKKDVLHKFKFECTHSIKLHREYIRNMINMGHNVSHASLHLADLEWCLFYIETHLEYIRLYSNLDKPRFWMFDTSKEASIW